MRKMTHAQRAERWYNRQVKLNNLRSSDYSFLSRRMALCYEPTTLLSQRQQKTDHDLLSELKILEQKIKL